MHPKIAVIDPNTLAMLGMKQLLAQVMPFAVVDGFLSFDELQAHDPEQYYHYFVASSIVIAHRDDFSPFVHKTIVLTTQNDPAHQLSGFRSLCINVPEQELIRQILVLEQHGHAHGKNLPAEVLDHPSKKQILSNREIEVLALLAQGKINKEIAEGAWRDGRTDATFPRLLTRTNAINNQPSDFWVEDKSYMRLKNIQIGYTLPSKWMQKIDVSRLRIYISGENLFTLTGYRGIDPEVSGTTYPNLRQYMVGINLSF